jgi:iron(III) transport system ATP-binding protein
MSLLGISNLSKRYGNVTALNRATLNIPPGALTAIVGASGRGKTTLLRLIAGFEAPDEGTITLEGREIAGPAAMVPPHRRGIGLVAQEGALFPHLSVADNVGFRDGVAHRLRRDRCAARSGGTRPGDSLAIRTSCRWAAACAWRWRGRLPGDRS